MRFRKNTPTWMIHPEQKKIEQLSKLVFDFLKMQCFDDYKLIQSVSGRVGYLAKQANKEIMLHKIDMRKRGHGAVMSEAEDYYDLQKVIISQKT